MPAAANLKVMPTIDEQLEHLRARRDLLDQRIQELEQVRQRNLQIGEKIGRVYGFTRSPQEPSVFRVKPAA